VGARNGRKTHTVRGGRKNARRIKLTIGQQSTSLGRSGLCATSHLVELHEARVRFYRTNIDPMLDWRKNDEEQRLTTFSRVFSHVDWIHPCSCLVQRESVAVGALSDELYIVPAAPSMDVSDRDLHKGLQSNSRFRSLQRDSVWRWQCKELVKDECHVVWCCSLSLDENGISGTKPVIVSHKALARAHEPKPSSIAVNVIHEAHAEDDHAWLESICRDSYRHIVHMYLKADNLAFKWSRAKFRLISHFHSRPTL